MPDTPRPRRQSLLTDTDAKRILARAAELDARSGSLLTTNDLRQIAADAGISSDALERALWEDDIPEAAARPSEARSAHSLLRTVGLLGIGAVLGALALMLDTISLGTLDAVAVFGPSAAFTLFRAMRHRRNGNVTAFLHEMAITFGSFTVATFGIEGTQAVAPSLAWALVCAITGTAIVADGVTPNGERSGLTPSGETF